MPMNDLAQPRPRPTSRRAAILVAMVLVLAMVHLIVVGSLAPAQNEAELTALRVQTIRAFYAAEAGALVVIRKTLDNDDPIPEGDTLDLAGGQVVFVTWPVDGVGQCVVEGRSGRSVRRLSLELE